ncbi:aminotransferase class III-fold pyridoxal phosphate-dependent enzyme [Streptomyces sp. NPDC058000]|uniref:aminotransferase class III-fold pyridoxal phosphate-dependent enzyme n=1 Tax=Streptomyces sp. NPDC058000 TaxID=3346299 RepID=UPI0036E858A2
MRSAPDTAGGTVADPAGHDIAVVGMACRFPGGVRSPEDLWRLSLAGADAVAEIPRSRWQAADRYAPDPEQPGAISTKWAGCIEDVDRFDAGFFGISPHEARQMDPQQRLLLETAHEALEDAGVPRRSPLLAGGGVFVGISGSDYGRLLGRDLAAVDAHFSTAQASSIAANRLSYVFDMTGPSMAVDTACSSSLVAVHLAVRSLRAGECGLALAGGVNVVLAPDQWVSVSKAGMMSPTGRCRSFGAGADGFVRSDGCGVVVLKTLARARADGDRVLGVIRGSAVNQDGSSNGLTAPNGPAQEAVIRAALADAGTDPARIGLVEAHGSGTPLGDPIEIGALAATYGRAGEPTDPCLVTSVKSNLGHTEAAAGMAGLIRLLLCLGAGQVPPTLHTSALNPRLPLDGTRLAIARRTEEWRAPGPRVGAVSSFGFGGTNAHVIVEQPAPEPAREPYRPPALHVLPLSAAAREPLAELAARYLTALDALPDGDQPLGDLCHSAAVCRGHHPVRAAFTGRDRAELRRQVAAFRQDAPGPDASPTTGGAPWRDTVFVFSGQGQQLAGSGAELLAEPVFAAHARRCARAFDAELGVSVLDELGREAGAAEPSAGRTDVEQALLFTLQTGLARLWESFGLAPAAVLGHSAGEAAAAHVSGLLDFDAATALVLARGAAMQTASGAGLMVSVSAPVEDVAPLLAGYGDALVVAVENGPRSVVVSGPAAAVREFTDEVARRGFSHRPLPGGFAFHSPAMAPAAAALRGTGAGRPTGPSAVPFFSSVTGALFDAARRDPGHWADGVAGRVRFRQAVRSAVTWGFGNFLEIGARPTLEGAVRATAAEAGTAAQVLHGARPRGDGAAGPRAVLAELYGRGAHIDWQAVCAGGRYLPGTPAYPWQRPRHWALPDRPGADEERAAPTDHEPTPPRVNRRNPLTEQHDWAVDEVRGALSQVLGHPREDIAQGARFLELGADSILLLRLVTAVNERHGTGFKAHDLFETYATVGDLAAALAKESAAPSPADPVPPVAAAQPLVPAAPRPATAPTTPLVEQVVRDQLALMQQQLSLLGQSAEGVPTPSATALPAAQTGPPAVTTRPAPAAPPAPVRAGARPGAAAAGSGLTGRQQEYVDGIVRRMEGRSPRSKQLAGRYRKHLVESRTWANFRPELKELNFPIAVRRARGARFWDVDGAEYTDYCLGFGVHFLGHNPPYVEEAVARQLGRSVSLGPQQELTYRVAEQFCRVTGHDRVTFTNTGSEAVMGAVRLARLATGRPKVVYFEKSYHGITEGMLGRGTGEFGGVDPISPGLSGGALADVVVLPYDDPASLDYLRAHVHEIAAVLVEPVQARNPVTQPVAFLRQLRELTATTGTVLIFDEMITGFRVGIRGAQGLFGITPDLATYGKILGGGLGISAIAGKKALLDGLDGGDWSYGDDSAPYAETTLFGGTFQKHPLSIAAAGAVLTHLEEHGERLYQEVNDRAAGLTSALSDLFRQRELPYSVATFGSLWRFQYGGLSNLYQPLPLEMLYHSLLADGLYVWEGRTFFLSTEHTDGDAERFLAAVDRNLDALHEAEFLTLGGADRPGRTATPAVPAPPRAQWPMSAQQRELWALCRRAEPDSVAYNEAVVLELHGPVDDAALGTALAAVRQRHPALRAVCSPDGAQLSVVETADEVLRCAEAADDAAAKAAVDAFVNAPFVFEAGPLFRCLLLRRAEDRSDLVIAAHHLVFDGMSVSTVLTDLVAAYAQAMEGVDPAAEVAVRQPVALPAGPVSTDLVSYWRRRLADSPAPLWGAGPAADGARPGRPTRRTFQLEQEVWDAVTARCPALRCTPFMVAFSAFTAALHATCGRDDLVVSVPVDQRPGERERDWVGHYVSYVPVRSTAGAADVRAHHDRTSHLLTQDLGHADVPLHTVLDALEQEGTVPDAWRTRREVTSVVFDLNPAVPTVKLGAVTGELRLPEVAEAKFDLFFDVIPVEGGVLVDIMHRDHVPAGDVERLWTQWCAALRRIIDDTAVE